MTSHTPIQSTFGERSTAEEVAAGIEPAGRRAIVTGASSGIGTETARVPADRGAAVTLAVSFTARVLARAASVSSRRSPQSAARGPAARPDGHSHDGVVAPAKPYHPVPTAHGTSVNASTCRGLTARKWRWSSVAITSSPRRSASATTDARVHGPVQPGRNHPA